jgi:hypothetical protein
VVINAVRVCEEVALLRINLVERCSLAALVAVGVLLLTPAARGQTGTYTELNPKGQKADSVPVSDRTVLFEVTMPSGKVAKLRAKEGGMAKIGDLDQGYAYALVPIIKDVPQRVATFTVFRLSQDKQGNESVQQLEQIEVDAAAPIATNSEPNLKLKVLNIEQAPQSSSGLSESEQKPSRRLTFANGKDCCLRCGTIWACGICVVMDCGCCCDSPYKCQPQ